MKKKIFVFFLGCSFLVGYSGFAHAISVGTFGDINNWVTSASRVSGTGGAWAGVDPVAALVGDDLTDGAINIGFNQDDTFSLGFSPGIINLPGDDFVIFEGRFSADGIGIILGLGVNNFVSDTAFIDTGLDLTLKNTTENFDLYGAALDLSDWGVANNAIINEMLITGYHSVRDPITGREYFGQADIMGVGVLHSVAPVPEPSTFLLLGCGLAGLVFLVRKRRKE